MLYICFYCKICYFLAIMLIISEKIHIKLCKYSLEVGRRSTNSAVLGELGRFPLILEAFLNVVKYWAL